MENRFQVSFRIPALALVTVLGCAPMTAHAQEDLFSFVEEGELELTGEQSERLGRLRAERTSKEVRVARVDLGRLEAGGALDLNPVPGESIALPVTRIERRSPEDYSWFGQDSETGASAVLVVQGDEVMGTIQAGGELYRIQPLGGGLQAVVEVDQSAFPPDHPPEFDREPEEPPTEGGVSP